MSVEIKIRHYLSQLPSQELLAIYNKLTKKETTRFESQMKGILATYRAIEKAGKLDEFSSMINNLPKAELTKEEVMAKVKEQKAAKVPKVKEKVAAAPKVKAEVAPKEKAAVDRSAAISASWADKSVRAARALRHRVKADGVEYPSVKKAFDALNLPISRHVAFRGLLAKEGKGEMEGHKFVVIKD